MVWDVAVGRSWWPPCIGKQRQDSTDPKSFPSLGWLEANATWVYPLFQDPLVVAVQVLRCWMSLFTIYLPQPVTSQLMRTQFLYTCILKGDHIWGWRTSSAVKNSCWSYREPEFGSHAHTSQSTTTCSSSSSVLLGQVPTHDMYSHTHTKKKHSHTHTKKNQTFL